MTNQIQNRALIVIGSKVEFTIFLTDEYGRPISITPYKRRNKSNNKTRPNFGGSK